MDPGDLDLVTRVVGVLAAVLGAGIGAQGGLARFRTGVRRHTTRYGGQLRVLVYRLLRRPLPIPQGTVISGTATLSAVVGRGGAWVWDSTGGVEYQLAHLRERTRELRRQISEAEQAARAGDAALQASIDSLSRHVVDETTRIEATIREMRHSDARAEAWSLPLLALGVALTALSPQVSGHGVLWWAVLMVVCVVVLPVAWWLLAVRDYPPPGTDRGRGVGEPCSCWSRPAESEQ